MALMGPPGRALTPANQNTIITSRAVACHVGEGSTAQHTLQESFLLKNILVRGPSEPPPHACAAGRSPGFRLTSAHALWAGMYSMGMERPWELRALTSE
jgi:hypothetical protein